MDSHGLPSQEPRSERAAIACTKAEKQAIRAVAAARQTDESNLLRTTLLVDVVAEFERIRAVVSGEAA